MTSEPSFTNQQLNSIVVDTNCHNPKYVFYLMRHYMPNIQKLEGGSASGREHVNKSNFENMEVKVHSLASQRRIAAILSAYDDLIENNQKRIRVLEETARLVYQEWFVNFRFPGHKGVPMVASELGEIPEGWRVRRVKDFSVVHTGKTPSKKQPGFYGDDIPFIKTPDMHGAMFVFDTGEKLSFLGAQFQKGKTVPANSLCVSCIGTVGVVSMTTEPSQTNQQINTLVPESNVFREYLYYALVGLKSTLERYGSTGATMANVSKGKFENLEVLRPRDDLLALFHTAASSTFDQIKVLVRKNRNLRQTRDLLLPKLISGELDVSRLGADPEDAQDLADLRAAKAAEGDSPALSLDELKLEMERG